MSELIPIKNNTMPFYIEYEVWLSLLHNGHVLNFTVELSDMLSEMLDRAWENVIIVSLHFIHIHRASKVGYRYGTVNSELLDVFF